MIFLISLSAVICTLAGGLFALRFHDKLHLILGFSAGAVLGVAFFDLLPESFNLGANINASLTPLLMAGGFAIYMILDRTISLHSHGANDCDHEEHHHHQRGILGAASLAIHSLLDGLAIGFSFQVSSAIGFVVTAAVLTHDFSDGINTVSLILKNGGNRRRAFRWLLVDAIAPAVGILITFFFVVSDQILAVLLALFTGFFLYLGASDLLPESHHHHPAAWTTISTILGLAAMFAATFLAGR